MLLIPFVLLLSYVERGVTSQGKTMVIKLKLYIIAQQPELVLSCPTTKLSNDRRAHDGTPQADLWSVTFRDIRKCSSYLSGLVSIIPMNECIVTDTSACR